MAAGEDDTLGLGFLFGNIGQSGDADDAGDGVLDQVRATRRIHSSFLLPQILTASLCTDPPQDALRQLANLTRQQKGVFDLGVAESDAFTAAEEEDFDLDDQAAKREQMNELAVDFMDEEELIDDELGDEGDLEEMMEAELENYDEDGDADHDRVDASAPAPASTYEPRLKITKENQAEEARKQGILLPVLGMTEEGDALLDFSHLFRSTLVMVDGEWGSQDGSVATKVPKRPPVKLDKDIMEKEIEEGDEAFLLADRKRCETDVKFKRRGTVWFPGDVDHEQQEGRDAEKGDTQEDQDHQEAQTDVQSEEEDDALYGEMATASHEDTGLFPQIPDYVFEPVFQREWEFMSRHNAMRSKHSHQSNGVGPSCVVTEVDEDEDEDKTHPQRNTVIVDDPIYAVYRDPIMGTKTLEECNQEIKADMGPSIIGTANNVLGSVPLLREFDAGGGVFTGQAVGMIDTEGAISAEMGEQTAFRPGQNPAAANGDEKNLLRHRSMPVVKSWSKVQNARFFFDLNDPNLVLEEDREDEEENNTTLAPNVVNNSSAIIMAPTKPSDIPDLEDIDDPMELLQAINISKDDVYFAAPKRKGIKGRAIHHSKFALQLYVFEPRRGIMGCGVGQLTG